MSNTRKRPGTLPEKEEWYQIAKNDKRLVEAASVYRRTFPNATLVEAARAVLHTNRKFKEAKGNRK